ncbi:ImmA/IrrE family metallo-endopeptidase [Piscibacillus halophilus]|uniref:ImmA/IrrE family metallo-endopeptidase n=1 Tax=Piscibacillus halophilus TaxID=571933 RepID=UPI00158C54BC|nr:ImmA/IrrE family metallo-endopeptidase [Piscibacillus halophilus]
MYIEEPKASFSVEQGEFRLININNNLADYEKKEQFYHELCHILRHYGNQMMMPKAFRELQERDARHFTLYAAIPFHMLHDYEFKDERIVEKLSIDFCIPLHIAQERVSRILRNATVKKKTVI